MDIGIFSSNVMSTGFFAAWGAILLFDGLLMGGFMWAVHHPRYSRYRWREPQNPPIPAGLQRINTALNNVFSLLIFAAYAYFLGDKTLYAGSLGVTTLLGEVIGVLLLYDFMYYFFHRLMHHRKLMRYCHNVHHRVRSPTANVSIFLNPIETFGGLGLLILAIVILGPISTTSFLVIFFIHSVANIIVHSNLNFPHPVFRLFNFWVQKHDVHHHRARNNYASIFPFWDQAFGTAE